MTLSIVLARASQTLALVAGIAGFVGDAFAQQPNQAQVNAIRQSCRNDYMAHCSSVTPGGAAALQCLQQHASSLSAACQQAVGAVKAPAAAKAKAPPAKPEAAAAPPAATPPAETAAPAAAPAAPAAPPAKAAKAPASKKAQLAAVARACGADYRMHCHGIRPGTGAATECLKRNAATLSPNCQHALVGVAAAKSRVSAAPAAAPAAVPAVAPAPALPPPLLVSPREEMFMLRTSCRGDYVRFCRGLRFGAGRVASCLHYNAANLSPPCQAALAALREGR